MQAVKPLGPTTPARTTQTSAAAVPDPSALGSKRVTRTQDGSEAGTSRSTKRAATAKATLDQPGSATPKRALSQAPPLRKSGRACVRAETTLRGTDTRTVSFAEAASARGAKYGRARKTSRKTSHGGFATAAATAEKGVRAAEDDDADAVAAVVDADADAAPADAADQATAAADADAVAADAADQATAAADADAVEAPEADADAVEAPAADADAAPAPADAADQATAAADADAVEAPEADADAVEAPAADADAAPAPADADAVAAPAADADAAPAPADAADQATAGADQAAADQAAADQAAADQAAADQAAADQAAADQAAADQAAADQAAADQAAADQAAADQAAADQAAADQAAADQAAADQAAADQAAADQAAADQAAADQAAADQAAADQAAADQAAADAVIADTVGSKHEKLVACDCIKEGAIVGGFVQGRELREAVSYREDLQFVRTAVNLVYGGELTCAYSTKFFFEKYSKAKGADGAWVYDRIQYLFSDPINVEVEAGGRLVSSAIQPHELLAPAMRIGGKRYLPKQLAGFCAELSSSPGFGFVCYSSDLLMPASKDQLMSAFELILLPQLPRGFFVLESLEYVQRAMTLAREHKLVRTSLLLPLMTSSSDMCV